MKRRIALLLSAVLIFVSALSGCGDSADNKSGLTTVRVWSGQAGSKVAFTKLVDEWNKTTGKKKGIYIQYEVFASTEYWKNAQEAIDNGTAPDIFRVPGNKRPYALNGDIVPIESFPGGEEFIESYGEPLQEGQEIYGGKTYYVNGEVTTYALIYNKDMFKKYGIVDENGEPTVPGDMTQYRRIAKKLTHPEDGCYGVGIPLNGSTYAGPMFYAPFSISVPADINYDEGTKDFTYYRLALEWIQRIKRDGSCFPGAELLDNDMMRSQFAAGRIGMFIGASWDVGVLTQQFPSECDWGVAPVPVAAGYEKFTNIASVTSGFCIGKNALKNDKAKVMEVFKFLHSRELQQGLYEAGVSIPRVPQIMEGADLSNTPEQWKEFAKQYTEIEPYYNVTAIDHSGITLKQAIGYVWSGKKTVSEVMVQFEEGFRKTFKEVLKSGKLDIEEAKRVQKLQIEDRQKRIEAFRENAASS